MDCQPNTHESKSVNIKAMDQETKNSLARNTYQFVRRITRSGEFQHLIKAKVLELEAKQNHV